MTIGLETHEQVSTDDLVRVVEGVANPSRAVVPRMKADAILLTLDPAAAYANLLAKGDDIHLACAHPCHPSVFLERTTKEEWADTFGGIAAPQDVVAAHESGDDAVRQRAETVIRIMYGPVIDVHWVTVKQLRVLEPTPVETIACMIGAFLTEALQVTVTPSGCRSQPPRRCFSVTPKWRSRTHCGGPIPSPKPASSRWTTAGKVS